MAAEAAAALSLTVDWLCDKLKLLGFGDEAIGKFDGDMDKLKDAYAAANQKIQAKGEAEGKVPKVLLVIGQMLAVSSATKPKTFLSGSTKKITCVSSACRMAATFKLSSAAGARE